MKKIFIGYLFIMFHLTINGLDLLADFVGYLLIYQGLSELSVKSASMTKGKPWAMGLTVYGIAVLLAQLYTLFTGEEFNSSTISVLTLFATIANLYVNYCIVIGVRELEEYDHLELGSKVLLQLWKMQLVLQVVLSVLAFVALYAYQLLLVLSIIALVVNIVYLYYFYKAMDAYSKATEKNNSVTTNTL